MPLTIEEVEHIAQLARLELGPDQKTLYRDQLSHILDYIAKLRQLDTTDVPPTAGGGLERMPLRADGSQPGLSTQALLNNAPEAQDDQFKIPPVFE
jgi:aspartyl-tRNA(Asn)/glutamyl-tRNA(Gln) amidotransferase subunit C